MRMRTRVVKRRVDMADLPRLLTLLPLCFFAIGWVLFVAGFSRLLSVSDGVIYLFKFSAPAMGTASSRTDLSLYPFYATLVGGPFVAVAGLLHAAVTILSWVL